MPTINPAAKPLLIIVQGPPASGKSTLAEQVAAELRLPCFSKDAIKEELYDSLGVLGVIERKFFHKLGEASMRLLYSVAGRVLEAGIGVVIEANFYRGVSEQELSALVERSRAVMIECQAPPEELKRRYAERAASGERHPVHEDSERVDTLEDDLEAGTYELLDLDCPVISVDTTQDYDPSVAEIVSRLREMDVAPAS